MLLSAFIWKKNISDIHEEILTNSVNLEKCSSEARVIEERLTVRQLDDIIKSNVTQSNDGAMDDVPLVDMNNNLEEMKKNATDINFADTQSGAQPSGSKFLDILQQLILIMYLKVTK